MNRRVRFWLMLAFGVGTALAVCGWIMRATLEVQHGRGADTYVSAMGLQVHWVDVLTMWTAVLVATLVMLVATAVSSWRRKRDVSQLKKQNAENSAASVDQDK